MSFFKSIFNAVCDAVLNCWISSRIMQRALKG